MIEGSLLLLELTLMFFLLKGVWLTFKDPKKRNTGFFAHHDSLATVAAKKQTIKKGKWHA